MFTAVIDGQAYRIDDEDPQLLIATGGEANVFRFTPSAEFVRRYGRGRFVLKIFRKATTDALRRAASERQTKLPAFPNGIDAGVIGPVALARDTNNQVIGYVMAFVSDGTPLIEFKSARFCRENSVTPERILRIMANLHRLVTAVHARGVVIGDFNDKNVLVLPNDEVCLLDADSFQYGNWECPTFVPGFVDPQIVEPRSDAPNVFRKIGRHSQLTDWYAFTVMLFQLLVRVHPYTDGFYASANGGGSIKGVQRIHRRISAFTPGVTLPDIATPFDRIPANIVECFRLVFDQDQRGIFPLHLLDGTAQATPSPKPTPPRQAPPATPRPQPRPGTTAATTPSSPGLLLAVALQGGQTRYVTHHNGAYRRQGGDAFWTTPYDNRITAIPAGNRTVMAADTSFVIFDGTRHSGTMATQKVLGRTTVAANSRHVYWLNQNELVRDDPSGRTVRIANIATHTTSVWVGERFGVALVQAGVLTRAMVFTEHGETHVLTLPPSFGSIVNAHCAISDKLAWLTVSTRFGGRTVNRCYVLDDVAHLHASTEANHSDYTWLGNVTPAAHAAKAKLLVPVPGIGIVRVGFAGRQIRQELIYPDSSQYVPTKEGRCLR